MVIEYLTFRVDADARERFVQVDETVWTSLLSTYPGFIEKEVWISSDNLEEVTTVIRWASLSAWKSIPADVLQDTDARFLELMGNTFQLIDAKSYQVRKVNR